MGDRGRPAPYPHHSGALQAPTGPLRWDMDPPRAVWLGTGIPLPVPTQSPYPYTRTRPAARAVASGACASSVTGTCTYDRFETNVGEPRGVEHTGVLRLIEAVRHVEAREALVGARGRGLAVFSTCFTEFSTRFTKFRTRITEFRTRITELWTCFTELWTVSWTSHMPHTMVALRTPFQS